MFNPRMSNRLKDFDYSSDNFYFITTNVKDRNKCFGKINDGVVELNIVGKIVERHWLWLQEQYKYIRLHEYIVMPDHFHGIIEINRVLIDFPEFENDMLGTNQNLSLPYQFQKADLTRLNSDFIKIKPLPELIGAFKSRASKEIHDLGLDFEWQRSFNDKIIKDKMAYDLISLYIRDNPKANGK